MNRHVSGVEEEYHSAVSRSQNASIKVEEGKKFERKIDLKSFIDKIKNFRYFRSFNLFWVIWKSPIWFSEKFLILKLGMKTQSLTFSIFFSIF